jgi:hypothetical protein
MSLGKKLLVGAFVTTLLTTTLISVVNAYIPSGRDTKVSEDTYIYEIKNVDDFEKVGETTNFEYYFKDARDALAIKDKRNGYIWLSGLDLPFPGDVTDACNKVSKNPASTIEEMLAVCVPYDTNLNSTYVGIANSLMVLEYFDSQRNIKRAASAAEKNVSSTFKKLSENKWVLDVKYTGSTFPNVQIKIRVNFTEGGVQFEIRDDDITGDDQALIAAITLNPYMGASGGLLQYFDPVTRSYDKNNIVKKNAPTGYVLVPDGPGGLIRFQDNEATLKSYVGDVYGTDPSTGYNLYEYDRFPVKQPTLPIFGIVHGDDTQSAFAAYASSGEEYMQIIVTPEENTTNYTIAYPRFVYNVEYFRQYNRNGDGYYTTMKERFHYDIAMNYDFLSGDGSKVGSANQGHPASYVGIALQYRDYLLKNHLITPRTMDAEEIPLRLDFIMSDSKKSVLGFEDVIVTTANDVSKIIKDVKSNGINNINSGLYGWQSGGVTLGRPYATDWNKNIGTYNDFKHLINDMKSENVDISFAQDYVNINNIQVDLDKDSTTHVNNWYPRVWGFNSYAPIQEFYYTKPTRSSEWAIRQTNVFKKMGATSTTIDGISSRLVSDYNKNRKVTLTESKQIMADTYKTISENNLNINSTKPNLYLLSQVSRNLQMDMFTSQHIIETDTVPFVQLVLSGTMELYASYSNFSFYTTSDALRMIDYNVYPSFILSEKPSYLLSKTNSQEFYSTEYIQYKPNIISIYNKVNSALKNVINQRWVGRKVLKNGLVENTYENGTKIIINYTESNEMYNGQVVNSLDYLVVGGN